MKLRVRDSKQPLVRKRTPKSHKSLAFLKESKSSQIDVEKVTTCTSTSQISKKHPVICDHLLYTSSLKTASNVTFTAIQKLRCSTVFNLRALSPNIETRQRPLDLSTNHSKNSPTLNDFGDETISTFFRSISAQPSYKDISSEFGSDEEAPDKSRCASGDYVIGLINPGNSRAKNMLSSRRHRSDETFADRENLAGVAGKPSYPHSADAWLDPRSSPDGEDTNRVLVDEDRDQTFFSQRAYDEEVSVNDTNDDITDDVEQDVAFNYSIKNRPSAQEHNSESKLKQAKRERIENVVISIKDKPSKTLTGESGDLEPVDKGSLTQVKKRKRGEKIRQLQKEIEYLEKEREEICDDVMEGYDVESDEIEQSGDWIPDEKRPRYASNIENSRDVIEGRNGFYRGSVNFMMSQNGRRSDLSTQDMAYQILVQSIKQELTTALEKVAEKSAKRILEQLHTNNSDQIRDNDQSRNRKSEEFANKDDNHRFSSKKYDDGAMEISKSNKAFSNTSRFVVDDKTERVRTSNQSQMCFGDVQVRKKQDGESRQQKSTSKNFTYNKLECEDWENRSHGSSSTPEKKTSTGEQTQALSLVKKRNSSPNSNKSSPSLDGRPFVIRNQNVCISSGPLSPHQENDVKNSSRSSRVSISSEPALRSGITPPDSASKNKLFHPSFFPDSNFYSPTSSAFRLPLRNDAISSSFRREPFTSSNLLKAPPFSFGPSFYPSSANSQSVFPFSTGQLPFPLFQSIQHNRLANAIADYGRFKEGYDHGTSRPVSTRTSTREHPKASGIHRLYHGPKSDAADYKSLAAAEVSQHSIASIQEGLTPQHLKKAKLMFFYTRYPSANTLKTFFNDVKFSRATTSQLIKWFSNFREFYYIQMEKFARQALSDGVTDINQLQITRDSELFRVLNLHYNKSNDFRVPNEFLSATLRSLQEFFLAIQKGKDHDPSWKKVIYKIICKLDQDIPELFKLPNVLEHLDEIAS